MSEVQPDVWVHPGDYLDTPHGWTEGVVPVIDCSDPRHVVAKLVEAGVLVRLSDPFDINKGEPMYRINLPEEALEAMTAEMEEIGCDDSQFHALRRLQAYMTQQENCEAVEEVLAERDALRTQLREAKEALEKVAGPCDGTREKVVRRGFDCDCAPCVARRALGEETP